jgi:hypothetical protein
LFATSYSFWRRFCTSEREKGALASRRAHADLQLLRLLVLLFIDLHGLLVVLERLFEVDLVHVAVASASIPPAAAVLILIVSEKVGVASVDGLVLPAASCAVVGEGSVHVDIDTRRLRLEQLRGGGSRDNALAIAEEPALGILALLYPGHL